MDQNKFMQAINNLLSNPIKFTPAGGTITVRVAQREDQAVVSIEDTGIGIPESLQAGLFEKFTQARRPGLRGERSTGLGLSIIKTIVELRWSDKSGQNRVLSFPCHESQPPTC